MEEKFNSYNVHLQNIILDEFYYFSQGITTIDLKKTFNNYIFGVQDFYHQQQVLMSYVIDSIETYLIMKQVDFQDFLPQIKIKIFDEK